MDKQEVALNSLSSELDKMLKRNLVVTRVRMSLFTMNRLFSGTIDVFYAAKKEKENTKDSMGWPIGAFGPLGEKYGPNAYLMLDNNVPDGEVCIDTTKNKE